MSEHDDVTEEFKQPDELTSLKAKADIMGLTYHPSIGVDKLRLKINNALSDNPAPDEDEEEDSAEPTPEELKEEAPVVSSIPKPTEQAAAVAAPVAPAVTPEVKEVASVPAPAPILNKPLTVAEARDEARKEAMRLVRINVTCMNPLKKEWDGEIITVGNNLVGTVSKMVPFNTTEGWHVPNIIYLMLKERQFQQFSAKKVKPGQPQSRVTKLVREFAIEVLDPLTEQELKDLRQRQLAAKGQE